MITPTPTSIVRLFGALSASVAVALTGAAQAASAKGAVTAATFEKSPVFKRYPLEEKDSWQLKVGGTNYYYRFASPAVRGQSVAVEMGPAATNIRNVSVSFPAQGPVNQLDAEKAAFVKALLLWFDPTVNANAVLSFVRANAGTSYPGGSDAMPRKQFGKLKVYAGTNMELIIGFER